MNTTPDDEQPARGAKGRPKKWTGERRIPPIYEGRMRFQPGDAHPMDAQIDEARQLRQEIIEQLEQVQQLIMDLGALDDSSTSINREEQAITQLLWNVYGTRKHRDHILATFIASRRRHMLQRLQATSAALQQARAFLTADAVILPRLQQVIRDAQAADLALHGPPPRDQPEPEPAEPTEEELPAAASVGLDDQAEEGTQDERRALLYAAGGGDDGQETKAALAAFEERARTMRSAIASGHGWFEWFFVKKTRRYTEEARAYLQRDEPIPPDVQQYVDESDTTPYGPYLRYRWYEGGGRKNPIKYSLGMGLIKRPDPRRSNEPPPL